jgi:hypothetical protein
MAIPHDPPGSPIDEANVRAADVEAEKSENKMHARPLEPEPLRSKVKGALDLIGALLGF